jgi:DNA-binding XRE family transcriptional regulator
MRSDTATTVSLMDRHRDPRKGIFTGGCVCSPAQIEAEKRRRAKEWKTFRRNHLYSQVHLAAAIGCAVRTVSKVESGHSIPSLRIQRAFRDLVREQKRLAAA